tara:strand:+ start:1307 stop:3013 length:1707 start_codon:yes stop_codon:yes gene_type:complete
MADTQTKINELLKDQASLEDIINSKLDKRNNLNKEMKLNAKQQLKDGEAELEILKKRLEKETKLSSADKKRNILISKAQQLLGKELKLQDKRLKTTEILTEARKITNDESIALLTNIEEKEKEILGSMNEKGILSYDIEETQKEITALTEQLVGLNKEDAIVLNKRIGLLQGEHELLSKAAEKAQARNKFLDMGLSTMGSSVAALKGMVKGAKAFAAAIIANPLMAIAAVLIAIVGYLWGAVTATRDMSKEMGVSLGTAAKMQGVIKSMPIEQAKMKLLGRDLADSATAIYHATRSTRDINKENVKTLSTLAAATGTSETNIANMARMFADMNGMSFKKGLGMVTATANLAKQFGVDKGAVISDIAESAEDFATYTNGSMKNLQMAAIHAQKMGTSLATTMKMTESLLDFETSITNTMEASMMIGKNLNFDKARMLAMDNDILGATNEIVRQLGSAEEFTRLSAIQRKKLAASIGVEVSELSRLVSGKPLEISPEDKQKKLEETQLDATKELTAAIEVLTKTMTKDITSKIGAGLEKGAEIAKATGGVVGAAYIPMDYLWKKLMNSTD